MNQVKLLALILLLSLSILGAGYAYWSETVTINETVSTGELSVEFEPYDNRIEVEDPMVLYNNNPIDFPDCRVVPFTLQDANHTLSAGFVNVFPGLYYSVPFKIKNNGTIPAIFKRCTVTSDMDDSYIHPGESEADLLLQLNENLKISSLYFKIFDSNDNKIGQTIYCVSETTISLGQLDSQINSVLGNGNIRLEPGQYLQVVSDQGQSTVNKLGGKIKFLFSSAFGNEFENRRFSVNIHMEWKQYNEIN
jgi:predicted ribosomally synthesized peptide with SipW-like signal peptide